MRLELPAVEPELLAVGVENRYYYCTLTDVIFAGCGFVGPAQDTILRSRV